MKILNLICLIRKCNILLNGLKVNQSWQLKGSHQALFLSLSLFLIEYIKPGVIQGFNSLHFELPLTNVLPS